MEQKRIKIRKIKYDIKFLQTCKRNNLSPTFAKPKFSIKMNFKTRKRIAKMIIEAELTNKHKRLKELKKEVTQDLIELKATLGFVTYCSLNKTVNQCIKGKSNQWKNSHDRKLRKLFKDITPKTNIQRPGNIVHNFSSYQLNAEEQYILSFGLDHHIPMKLNGNTIKTEFEAFYYHLDKQLKHLSNKEKEELKTNLRKSCENYYKIKNSNKIDNMIKRLAENNNVTEIKQDKGRGVVLMDRSKYVEKVMKQLNTENFKELTTDKTKAVEESIQRALLAIKPVIGESDYSKIYPSGSNPGKFYGTAKVHKLKSDDQDKINKLPLRPIISNVGTATHKTAQYLCNLLSPLGKSEYNVLNTKEFVQKIKKIKVPKGYVTISFDVVSLFTNVPLRKTIDIILRKVYDDKLIDTKIPKKNMEKLLLLCTQGTPFTFNGKMYVQVDGVMMGSPLGALFANIFMCELENTIIPSLGNKIHNWTRYVDDTFAFIKPNTENEIKNMLNSFHENIKFTYEHEQNNTISFLDVLITRLDNGTMETSVFRKPTHTDVYLNWNADAPKNWKVATVKSLVKRAFIISSTSNALDKELLHIKNVFTKYNNYPENIIQYVIANERENANNSEQSLEKKPTNDDNIVTLQLPYAGEKGENIIKKMKKVINTSHQQKSDTKIRIIYNTQKLSSRFPTKDKTDQQHLHNVVYRVHCPQPNCKSTYIGQTKCRLLKRVIQHNKVDKKSHILIHSNTSHHNRVWLNDFTLLGRGYKSNFKRQISEALYIKELTPDLNIQKDAYRLKLY